MHLNCVCVCAFWIVFWLRPDFSDLVLDCLALTPSPTILLRFAKIRYFCIPPFSLTSPLLPFVACTFEMEKKLKRRKGVIYESLFLHLYLAYNAHTSLSLHHIYTHTHTIPPTLQVLFPDVWNSLRLLAFFTKTQIIKVAKMSVKNVAGFLQWVWKYSVVSIIDMSSRPGVGLYKYSMYLIV